MLPSQLPETLVAEVSLRYTRGASYKQLETDLHITSKVIRRALQASGTPARPRGWPVGRPGNRDPQPRDNGVDWENAFARNVAEEAARVAAELAVRDQRCVCGGIRRPGVTHQCIGRTPLALAFEGCAP